MLSCLGVDSLGCIAGMLSGGNSSAEPVVRTNVSLYKGLDKGLLNCVARLPRSAECVSQESPPQPIRRSVIVGERSVEGDTICENQSCLLPNLEERSEVPCPRYFDLAENAMNPYL